jgi:competence protein ComEC
MGGAEIVAQLFGPTQVCASPIRFRSRVYREALTHLNQKPGLVRNIARNDSLFQWAVFHPDTADHFPKADDNALVLRAEIDGTKVLLCSDLGRLGQSALIARNADLRADILVTGLPTGSEPVSDALLRAVQPRVIIVADSEYPASERADRKLKERLEKKKIPVIYTRAAGAITLEFNRHGYAIRAMNDS